MAVIRPDDLPAATSVNPSSALIVDSGSAVEKATPLQVVDAAIPLASEAEAEAGTDNEKRVTPLRVKQAIDALAGLTSPVVESRAYAETVTIPAPIVIVQTGGYWEAGDKGGALYARVVSEPSHAGKFEDASGAWFEICEDLVNGRQFGMKADGTTLDNDALADLLTYLDEAVSYYTITGDGKAKALLPAGVIRINESGILSTYGSTKRNGYCLEGQGAGTTILWMDPAGAAADLWFYDNGATTKNWGAAFQNMTFSGGTTWRTLGVAYSNLNAFNKGFQGTGPGWECAFVFSDCEFRWLDDVGAYVGGNNVDTWRYEACEFAKCNNLFYIDNSFSMAISCTDCYASQIFGSVLRYGSGTAGGGTFNWKGGAVITTGESGLETYLLDASLAGPTTGNGTINFTDAYFELREPTNNVCTLGFVSSSPFLIFKGCSILIDGGDITVNNFAEVLFDATNVVEYNTGVPPVITLGGSSNLSRAATVSFVNGCALPDDIFDGLNWAQTPGRGRLTIDRTCLGKFSAPVSEPQVIAYACDIVGTNGVTSSFASRTSVAKFVNPLITTACLNTLAGVLVQLPPYSTLKSVYANIPVGSGIASPIRIRVGSEDSLTVYAETTVGNQNAGQTLDATPWRALGATLAGNRVRIWVDDGAGSAPAAGVSAGALTAMFEYL